MSDLPEKWRKGNLPEGWGKNHILSHSSVPEEHPKPPVKTVEAGRQTEDADNQVTEQQLEQERATVFEDISSSTQGSKIFTEDNNHSILVNAIAEHRAKVTVDRPSPRHSASRVPSYQPIYSREPGKPRNIEESDIVTKKYDIGSRIRKYREESGMSQKELASRINVSNSRISNWEQGLNRPDADVLADICRALNISPSELLNVHLCGEELSSQERKVIQAYRDNPDLQQAVNILLGLEKHQS